jgi:hypothetical protein
MIPSIIYLNKCYIVESLNVDIFYDFEVLKHFLKDKLNIKKVMIEYVSVLIRLFFSLMGNNLCKFK